MARVGPAILVHTIGNHSRDVREQMVNLQFGFQQFLHLSGAEAGSGRSFLKKVAVVASFGAVKTHSVYLQILEHVCLGKWGSARRTGNPPREPRVLADCPISCLAKKCEASLSAVSRKD